MLEAALSPRSVAVIGASDNPHKVGAGGRSSICNATGSAAQFGPVVLVGDGGVHLEALSDFRLLLPPYDEAAVLEKLRELRVAPPLGPLRGRPPRDVQAFAGMAVRLGEAMLEWNEAVTLIDVNPVVVFETGRGAVAVDALVECRLIISAP